MDREPHHLETMIGDYLKKLEREQRQRFFQMGLDAASALADNWADQCCGGSGEGGEGYRNLACAQRRLKLNQ